MAEIPLPPEAAKFKATKDVLNPPKPFVIRGHHFKNFIAITREETDPDEEAMEIRESIEAVAKKKPVKGKLYKYDTIGKTDKEAQIYQKRLKKVFEKFVDLPDNYPVQLTTGKDNICNTCTIGKHCGLNDQSPYAAGQQAWAEDEICLEIFQDLAKKHNIKIKISEEIVRFTDIGPQKTTAILSTAGHVKEIFQDKSFKTRYTQKWNFYENSQNT
jgi:hypothetical protein